MGATSDRVSATHRPHPAARRTRRRAGARLGPRPPRGHVADRRARGGVLRRMVPATARRGPAGVRGGGLLRRPHRTPARLAGRVDPRSAAAAAGRRPRRLAGSRVGRHAAVPHRRRVAGARAPVRTAPVGRGPRRGAVRPPNRSGRRRRVPVLRRPRLAVRGHRPAGGRSGAAAVSAVAPRGLPPRSRSCSAHSSATTGRTGSRPGACTFGRPRPVGGRPARCRRAGRTRPARGRCYSCPRRWRWPLRAGRTCRCTCRRTASSG